MEQAFLDALKTLPGAAIVGIPLALALRALWTELKEMRGQMMKAMLDGIAKDIETKNVLDKNAERIEKFNGLMEKLIERLMKGGK